MDILPLLLSSGDFGMPGAALPYIAISLALGVVLTAAFYLLSYVLNHPPFSALAKEELASLVVSVLIIGCWGFIALTLKQFACLLAFGNCNFTGSGYIPPAFIDISYASLELLFVKLKSIYVGLYLYEVLVGFLSTVYVPLGTFNPALALLPISVPPLVGLVLLSNAHTVLVEAIGMTMVAVIAKQHLLIFAKYAIPAVLLPMGLVLRAFPWYRTTGSSIIAICVAGYFIYPLTTLLSNYIIFDLYRPVDLVYAPSVIGFCKSGQAGIEAKASSLEKIRELWYGDSSKAIAEAKKKKTPGPIDWLIGIWDGIKSAFEAAVEIFRFMVRLFGDFTFGLLSLVWGGGAHTGVVSGLYYFIVEEVVILSQFVIAVIVTSVFEIIITVTMYRNISLLIGGEMELVGLSKLV